jgi:D-alanine-D-alanine ligase-like ATP-grasp enzyme
MTANSLVPKAAAAVGIRFPELVEDLCRDGVRRHRPRSQPGA